MIFSNYVLKLFKLNIIFLDKKRKNIEISFLLEIEFDEYYLLNCISLLMLKKRNVSCTQENCKYRYHGSSHWQTIRTTCCSFVANY